MIRFKKVTKTFPSGTTAFANLTFEAQPGEFIAITGPSGSGKTTVLRLILHELLPTSGQIMVDKIDLSSLKNKELPKLRQTIGAIFQDFKILEDQTAAENVSLIFEILGETFSEATKKSVELLNLVGLKGKELLFPRQLSGGEIQRVAIARALALKPKIIFADEPTANLDEFTAKNIISLLKEINSQGTTILVATHSPHLLKDYNARTINLEEK